MRKWCQRSAKDEAERHSQKSVSGEELPAMRLIGYRSAFIVELGKMYADKQWVMQLHIGAIRRLMMRQINV